MWSQTIRFFLTVALSVTFLILFGGENIKRYQEGGIAKIRDEKEIKYDDIPYPGQNSFKFFHVEILLYSLVIIIADSSNVVELGKLCKGKDIKGCMEKDKHKILETGPSNQSYYADWFRKVYCQQLFL